MSEIIIETPSTTRERLVLVPALHAPCPNERDATPDDLARGGYVPQATMVGHLRVKNELADAIERLETAETELSAETIRADAWKAKAIEAEANLGVAESANEEAGELLTAETARAETAEGLLIQRETELRLAREDGAAVERQMREARSATDASFVRANRAILRAEKAERELEDAESRAAHMLTVIRERDAARADASRQGEEAAHLRCRMDDLRAELARLTAPGEVAYREQSDFDAGVAHERARSATPVTSTPVSSDRATDEELDAEYVDAAMPSAREDLGTTRHARQLRGILAVAARVRQERCLVAQAVALKAWVSFWHCDAGHVVQVGGHMVSRLPAADVPATLARLLGEVSR